jgi:hypothetical protein
MEIFREADGLEIGVPDYRHVLLRWLNEGYEMGTRYTRIIRISSGPGFHTKQAEAQPRASLEENAIRKPPPRTVCLDCEIGTLNDR